MPLLPAAAWNASNGGCTEREAFSLQHKLALAHERVMVTHFPQPKPMTPQRLCLCTPAGVAPGAVGGGRNSLIMYLDPHSRGGLSSAR